MSAKLVKRNFPDRNVTLREELKFLISTAMFQSISFIKTGNRRVQYSCRVWILDRGFSISN